MYQAFNIHVNLHHSKPNFKINPQFNIIKICSNHSKVAREVQTNIESIGTEKRAIIG